MDLLFILCLTHQYLAKVVLIESPTTFGILKRLTEYIGMACAIVLINTSLPALEISFSFHPKTLFFIQSCISLKVFTFDFPLAIGSRRYFSQLFIILAPNNCYISLLTSSVVFLLKNKESLLSINGLIRCLFILT